MAAHYDSYNYPSYWDGRDYEHGAEKIAIDSLLSQLKKINSLIDIGGGYGRLVPVYEKYTKKVTLTDPSKKLIETARKGIKGKKYSFDVGTLKTISKKYKGKQDLVVMVRVMHHIDNIDEAISDLAKLNKKGGYLLVEFANKLHFKSVCTEIVKGNFDFTHDIVPKVVGKRRHKDNDCLPFLNYHPKVVSKTLHKHGYKILATRSVSNIRNSFVKKYIPMNLMLNLEKHLQVPLARFNFGPSIFILAKKSK